MGQIMIISGAERRRVWTDQQTRELVVTVLPPETILEGDVPMRPVPSDGNGTEKPKPEWGEMKFCLDIM